MIDIKWEDCIGKRILCRQYFYWASGIFEGILEELSPSGAFAKIKVTPKTSSWLRISDYEIVEVLRAEKIQESNDTHQCFSEKMTLDCADYYTTAVHNRPEPTTEPPTKRPDK